MRKSIKRMLTLCMALAMLSLPLSGMAEYLVTGWTMIEGVWYYVDESGALLDHDPYLFTLPPDTVPPQPAPQPAPKPEPAPQPDPEPAPLPEPDPQPDYVPDEDPEQLPDDPEQLPDDPEQLPDDPEQLPDDPEQLPDEQEQQVLVPVDELDVTEGLPQEDPAPVETPIPDEALEPDETPIPDETPEPQSELTVSIYVAYSGDQPSYGSTIQLLSVVGGAAEGAQLNYQWQYKDASGQWQDVPGANGSTYEYVLSEENDDYAWRLVVTP